MYNIQFASEVKKDIKKLGLTQMQILKLEQKVKAIALNPIPKSEGGLGEPLSGNLKGLLKFRFDNDYRVVYKLVIENEIMKILIIGLRSDALVYHQVEKRL